MQPIRLMVVLSVLGLAACGGVPVDPKYPAVQFQQAGPPFPYNSFYCP